MVGRKSKLVLFLFGCCPLIPPGAWDYGDTVFATNLVQAVQQNLTSEALMDVALTRIWTSRFRTGVDDPEVCCYKSSTRISRTQTRCFLSWPSVSFAMICFAVAGPLGGFGS